MQCFILILYFLNPHTLPPNYSLKHGKLISRWWLQWDRPVSCLMHYLELFGYGCERERWGLSIYRSNHHHRHSLHLHHHHQNHGCKIKRVLSVCCIITSTLPPNNMYNCAPFLVLWVVIVPSNMYNCTPLGPLNMYNYSPFLVLWVVKHQSLAFTKVLHFQAG